MELVFGHSDALAQWAAKKMAHLNGAPIYRPWQAIGVATGLETTSKLLAVVVYHDWVKDAATCQISIASENPLWAQKGMIRALLSVPFDQYGVKKLWSVLSHKNERAIKFCKGIGFRQEAILANQLGAGNHAVICSLMQPHFNKLYATKRLWHIDDTKRRKDKPLASKAQSRIEPTINAGVLIGQERTISASRT